MSFTFRGVDTANLDGVEVTPLGYVSAGGLNLDTVNTPGRDGRFYGGARREVTPIAYRVTVTGDTPTAALERRDALMRLLDPAIGPSSLVPDDETSWHFPQAALAAEIMWEKHAFGPGRKVIYDGEVFFETADDPSLREISPTSLSSPSSYTHDIGTTSSHPTITITPISSDSEYVISIGSFSVTVERFNSWTGNHRLVLDYDRMRFYLENSSGNRIASAVRHMSHFDRPTLVQGQTYSISVVPDRPYAFEPNARRL